MHFFLLHEGLVVNIFKRSVIFLNSERASLCFDKVLKESSSRKVTHRLAITTLSIRVVLKQLATQLRAYRVTTNGASN